jgi:hypothetical protein
MRGAKRTLRHGGPRASAVPHGPIADHPPKSRELVLALEDVSCLPFVNRLNF